MNQKTLGISFCIALLLSACAGGISGSSASIGIGTHIGRHVGVGGTINLPLGGINKKTSNTPAAVAFSEQQIITYFDTQGKAVNQAVKGGFQRRLLAKPADNEYLVQDFYESGEKRTDPMILNKEDVFQFRAHPQNGSYTVYAINGTIMLQQTFNNGKLINIQP